ncbi:MAG: response regulator [Lachnospiraceae bacterium]|nr:response regulator [Lachnospiraceae bacterium]
MYNIGICDDGENICAFIEDTLLKFALRMKLDINIKKWYAGESLRDYLVQGGHLDILFLDIELFGMTGIEVGSYIRKQLDNTEMQIIYISEEASMRDSCLKRSHWIFWLNPFRRNR